MTIFSKQRTFFQHSPTLSDGFIAMADDDEKGYKWEQDYERTWESLQEDAEGSLQSAVDDVTHQAKRKRMLERPCNIRLGMMRHLQLVLDMSMAMEDQDLKPSRLYSTLKMLEHFIEEYFDQNPISQLGIIRTRNKRAEKLTPLSGNPRKHIQKLKEQKDVGCLGEPSLQNSLDLAINALKNFPGHASREVLAVFGSLTTCDPGNIHDTIKTLKSHNIRVSIIGLAAEVRIFRDICQATGGRYGIILDENHYKDLLTQQVVPPPATSHTESSLIKMGFPHHTLKTADGQLEKPAVCMCHLDKKADGAVTGNEGYFCPQCKSKYCELPIECKVCGLMLVSAPHLARSYHHLFPLQPFTEVQISSAMPKQHRLCFGCQIYISASTASRCTRCQQLFCIDCDLFLHETLHSCAGCATKRQTQVVLS